MGWTFIATTGAGIDRYGVYPTAVDDGVGVELEPGESIVESHLLRGVRLLADRGTTIEVQSARRYDLWLNLHLSNRRLVVHEVTTDPSGGTTASVGHVRYRWVDEIGVRTFPSEISQTGLVHLGVVDATGGTEQRLVIELEVDRAEVAVAVARRLQQLVIDERRFRMAADMHADDALRAAARADWGDGAPGAKRIDVIGATPIFPSLPVV